MADESIYNKGYRLVETPDEALQTGADAPSPTGNGALKKTEVRQGKTGKRNGKHKKTIQNLMEITGKIIKALELRSGTSNRTGSNWCVQEFVIETIEGQYPRRCVFEVFGEDRLKQMNIQVGEEMTVSIDVDAREYNGRWYNSLRAWKVDRNVAAPVEGGVNLGAQPQAPQPIPAPVAVPAPEVPAAGAASGDDLPF